MNELIGFTLPYTENGVTKQFPFYYIKDAQGNICYIVDKFGKLVVSYNYDAWGNVVSKFFFKYGVANAKTNYSITLGTTAYTAQDIDNLNSHYYRGYYYDKETGFYYLTTRYYDPEIGRFISPDDPKYLDFKVAYGYNRYAYCNNNPVMGYDPKGTFALTSFLFSVAIGALIGVATSVITQAADNNWDFASVNPWVAAIDGVFGAIDGALSAVGVGFGLSMAINPLLSAAQTFLTDLATGELNDGTCGRICNSMIFSVATTGMGTLLDGLKSSKIKFGKKKKIKSFEVKNPIKQQQIIDEKKKDMFDSIIETSDKFVTSLFFGLSTVAINNLFE